MSTTPSASAVTDLQSHWPTLSDLDRASAVFTIHQAGTSLREVAKALNNSESLLRHLLTALQAPIEDRYLARQGKISTRELARRAKVAGTRSATKHHEQIELERAQRALQGCRTICNWLAAEEMPGSYGEQIVDEARRLFARAEQDRKFPKGAAPTDMPTAEIIQRCRPAEAKNNSTSFIARYAWWLALWVFYSMTDAIARDHALQLALERQWGR